MPSAMLLRGRRGSRVTVTSVAYEQLGSWATLNPEPQVMNKFLGWGAISKDFSVSSVKGIWPKLRKDILD